MTLSFTVGIPSGLVFPSAFGIQILLTVLVLRLPFGRWFVRQSYTPFSLISSFYSYDCYTTSFILTITDNDLWFTTIGVNTHNWTSYQLDRYAVPGTLKEALRNAILSAQDIRKIATRFYIIKLIPY